MEAAETEFGKRDIRSSGLFLYNSNKIPVMVNLAAIYKP